MIGTHSCIQVGFDLTSLNARGYFRSKDPLGLSWIETSGRSTGWLVSVVQVHKAKLSDKERAINQIEPSSFG